MQISRTLRGWVAPLHEKYRAQKLSYFFQELSPAPQDTLLDVGGGAGILGEFLPLYRYFSEVLIVNLDPPGTVEGSLRHVRISKADGCALPYEDQSFDWVFSNAVIEHVGGAERQRQFAREVRRVARKGYFVATPNRHFPIDPHTFLPFYQYLSPAMQSKVCRFSPGYLHEYEPIDLLSAKDLQLLFPGGVVHRMGLPGIPNNLVVYQKCATPEVEKSRHGS